MKNWEVISVSDSQVTEAWEIENAGVLVLVSPCSIEFTTALTFVPNTHLETIDDAKYPILVSDFLHMKPFDAAPPQPKVEKLPPELERIFELTVKKLENEVNRPAIRSLRKTKDKVHLYMNLAEEWSYYAALLKRIADAGGVDPKAEDKPLVTEPDALVQAAAFARMVITEREKEILEDAKETAKADV